MFHKIITNKIVICSFFLAILFVSCIMGGCLLVKSKLSDSAFLNSVIQKNTGLKFDADNLNLKYSFFAANIRANRASLSIDDSKTPLISIEKPYIKIKLLPLLFKKLNVECFYADYIQGYSKRYTDGSFDFLKYLVQKKSFFVLDLSKTKVNVKDYDFIINDYATKNNFMLDGHAFVANGLDTDKKLGIATDGFFYVIGGDSPVNAPFLIDIDYSKRNGKINLKKQEISLTSLNLSFLKSYLKDYKFNKFDAVVDINSSSFDKNTFKLCVYLDKIALDFDYNGDRNTILSDKPIISELIFSLKNKDLVIKNGEFWADGANIKYSGVIKNLSDLKNAVPQIKVRINNTDLNKLAKILPDTLIPMREPYIQKIKKHNANALADGDISIRYKNRDNFDVRGKINFEDVYVVERPKNAKTAFGSCEFVGQEALINVYVNAPENAMLTVFGKTKMQLNPDGEFNIKSHGKIDLEFAHKVLMPVQDIVSLKLGPLPYMGLKGHGDIILKTKGNKEKANLKGKFWTNDATVTLNGLNTVLTNGVVDIIFDNYNILFNGATGVIEGANAKIDGSANTNGDLDVKVSVPNISAVKAMKIAQTSSLVASVLDGGEFLKSFVPKSGNIDFYLNIYGNAPPDAKFGERSDTVFAKGKIIFKNNALTILPNIKGEDIAGTLEFQNNTKFDLKAKIFNSPFKITGNVAQKGAKNGIIHGVPSNLSLKLQSDAIHSSSVGNFIIDNISLFAPQNQLFAKNLAQIFNTNNFKLKGDIAASGLVYPNNSTLDLSDFDFQGYIQGINDKNSDFNFKQGNITLKGKNLKFNNLRILASKIDFLIDGNIDKFASLKPFNNLKITFFKSSFYSYMNIFSKMLPEKQKKIVNMFKDYTGSISGKIRLFANNIDGEIIPDNVSFTDAKSGAKIVLKDGSLKLKNDKTHLKAFNFSYGEIPVFVDGFMQTSGVINPELNIFATTVLNENACDKYINPYLKYPVAINGEVSLKGRIQGKINDYTTYLTAVLDKGSDVSYMGLKLGDEDFKREFSSKVKFAGNLANIDYMRYFKYVQVDSKRQAAYDILKVSGGIRMLGDDIAFNNFKFTTPNPAPVRLINLLFRRSLIKDGTFTSNLVLNGSVSNIKANGTMLFSNVLVPMYDSVIDNINVVLNHNTGKASFKLTVYDTVVDFIADFENKATLPAVINNLAIHSDSISVDNLIRAFSLFGNSVAKISNTPHSNQTQGLALSPSDVLIKKGSINVDKIIFNGVEGNDLKINFSNSSKSNALVIDNSYLGIAGGLFKGKGEYNFDNNYVTLSSDFINCDANELTKAFLKLSGQIYGNASGSFTISMKDFTPSDYVKKIKASAEFDVSKGKMPKLGSVEYLLRASSLIRSGLLGLTLNNVIELLKPYRQGEFNKITGTLKVEDAIVKDLKIYSQGDNLSTYTSGTYDISTGISQIEILGKLSKKVSNLLGPVGNASVISVLNVVTKNKVDELARSELLHKVGKIPFLSLNNDEYRLFSVKLNGEVSTSDAVKSFNWLN